MNANKQQSKWSELLLDAVTTPGKILEAYSAFHNYSIGNALLALSQCLQRNLTPGPLNTYKGWQELGRNVQRGERALTLCMPVTAKKKTVNPETKKEEEHVRTYFVFRPFWFVLSQTGGDKPYEPTVPGFDFDRALEALEIKRIGFDMTDGNVQGFARDRSVAVSPIAQIPTKTLLHEVAHVVLGHTTEESSLLVDQESTPRALREVEAEGVALICLEALGLEGAEYCRGYLKHWLGERKEIPAHSVQKILAAASRVLKAGQTERIR